MTKPGGSVIITNNDTLVGIVPIDEQGKATYRVVGLTKGTHVFKAKYSGNTVYTSQTSNTVKIELAPTSTSQILNGKSRMLVFTKDHHNYLSGTKTGDNVILYNSVGQKIASFIAQTNLVEIDHSGITLIEVWSGRDRYMFKTVY